MDNIENVEKFIDETSWPAPIKERAKMTAKARKDRCLDPLSAEQWQKWASYLGGAGV